MSDNKRSVLSGDALKGRRETMKSMVVELLKENPNEALHLGGWVKKWEAKTGTKHDRISWYDTLHALEDLAKVGEVVVVTPEKGRVTYKATKKEDDKQLSLDL